MITSAGYVVLAIWFSIATFAVGTAVGENAELNKHVDPIEVVQVQDSE